MFWSHRRRSFDVASTSVVQISLFLLLLRVNDHVAQALFGFGGAAEFESQTLAGYTPKTSIWDMTTIDQDIRILDELFGNLSTEEVTAVNFAKAKEVYQFGAYNMPYAVVQLNKPLAQTLPANLVVSAYTNDGDPVQGKLINASEVGSRTMYVQYTTVHEDITIGCYVGSNPFPDTKGCFAETGMFIAETENGEQIRLEYLYDPLKNNLNERSLSSMSLNAGRKFRPCNKCDYYRDFRKFYYYYGTTDFAHQIVQALFDGTAVEFKHGSQNFSGYELDARGEAIERASSYLNLMQWTYRELELTIDKCENSCRSDECLHDTIHTMESSVAFYVGSLEKADGTGQGYLMYALADELGAQFRTMGPLGDQTTGTSRVNLLVMQEYEEMRDRLMNWNCTPARRNKDRIRALMSVPLVQAVYREAYIGGKQGMFSPVNEARGAIYAASIIPTVGLCSPPDAQILHENMRSGKSGPPDYNLVRAVFERNYHCLQITCDDVGGYYVPPGLGGIGGGYYYEGALPCGLPEEHMTLGKLLGIILGSVFSFLILFFIFLFKCLPARPRKAKKKSNVELQPNAEATHA